MSTRMSTRTLQSKKHIKLQNTMNSRGKAIGQRKSSILWFSLEREKQSANRFNLSTVSKLQFITFQVYTPSREMKRRRMSYTQERENGKLRVHFFGKIQNRIIP